MKLRAILTNLLLVLLVVSCSLPDAFARRPTATPTSTSTPTPSQTPTATPTPTETPTPPPAVLIENADRSIQLGDYDKTLQEYQAALNSAGDPESQAAAMLGAGRVYIQTGDHQQALDTLRLLVDKYPYSLSTTRAYFFLGQVYTALQRYPEAAEAYNQYLTRSPGVLDAYVQELRGDALVASQDYTGALSAYQAALQAPHLGDNDWMEIKIGRTAALNNDTDTAIARYEGVLALGSSDSAKAQAGLLEGQVYMALGKQDQAYNSWLQIVKRFPSSYDSYSALVALVNEGVTVDEQERGLVDYFAGQYSLAAEAFGRYLESSQAQDGTALHYRALSLRAVGEEKYPPGSTLRSQANTQGGVPEDAQAIAAWQTLITSYPNDRFWSDAWDEIAYTQWAYMDQPKLAAQTMLDFVLANPTHPRAAEFLFAAGRYLERGNLLDDATRTWERMGSEYPSAGQTFRGLLFAGTTHFRQNQMELAYVDFQLALLLAMNASDQAAAELWTGKVKKSLGDLPGAQAAWQSAASRDPTGYYSIRASELLADRAPLTIDSTIDLAVDLGAEHSQAQAWVLDTFKLPAETRLDELGALITDARFTRGQEFWALGLYNEARAEFEDLRVSVQSDPADTFRLVQFFYDLGLYRSAILASRQVLTLAGMDDAASLNAPVYFNHIRFGTYYKDQVLPLAQADGFNPLLVFSLIRQESMFESFIQSSAGARGLMQLMPATAQGLVDQTGWPSNYTDQDLYRPIVNLKLGVDYLARQRQYFDGDLYAMLAAYNGGPGNTSAWKDLAGSDPDLFLETVRIQETRDYVMRVAELFGIYERLYGRNP